MTATSPPARSPMASQPIDPGSLVSAAIPTFNAAAFLAEAVYSALGQSHRQVEVLVIDDGSTDDTEEVLRPFRQEIRYFRQDRAGPSAARNRGILNARGRYVAFLDADDVWLPEKLELQVGVMNRQPEVVLTYSDFGRGRDAEEAAVPQLR